MTTARFPYPAMKFPLPEHKKGDGFYTCEKCGERLLDGEQTHCRGCEEELAQ